MLHRRLNIILKEIAAFFATCFNTVDDEFHVILHCLVYNDLRPTHFAKSH